MPDKFPLVVWESTANYKMEAEEAQKEYAKLRGGRANLQFDKDGKPEFWFNSNSEFRQRWGLDEALREAHTRGDTGWWNLEEISRLNENKGPIMEGAMWRLGFRRHKRDPSKWARVPVSHRWNSCPAVTEFYKNRNKKTYANVSDEEAQRLKRAVVMPNESAGMSKTYDIQVGSRGMIYIALWANPFAGHSAETLDFLASQLANKGHIATQQEGFVIEAVNIQLPLASEKKADHIRVTAIKPNASYAECVWPSQIPAERIFGLAGDLVERVKRIPPI